MSEPTIREVIERADRAAYWVTTNYLIDNASTELIDDIRFLQKLARKGLETPTEDQLKWANMHDPVTYAAYCWGWKHGSENMDKTWQEITNR